MKIADAAFIVNPFSISGFQAGFECPFDATATPVINFACFYAGNKAPWAIDISTGTWTVGQIHGVNFNLDPTGNVSATSYNATGSPPAFAGQVTYGGAYVVGNANCGGSAVAATGCLKVGVNGVLRWMPYF